MNLLNALAVADAKEMLEDADLEMLHSLLTTVAFWEKVVHGDPENRLRWCLLPLTRMVSSSWWPINPHILSVLSPSPLLQFLPNTSQTWADEFPNDFFWTFQARVRVQMFQIYFPRSLLALNTIVKIEFLLAGGIGLERQESEGGGDGEGVGGGSNHQERLGKGQQQSQLELRKIQRI